MRIWRVRMGGLQMVPIRCVLLLSSDESPLGLLFSAFLSSYAWPLLIFGMFAVGDSFVGEGWTSEGSLLSALLRSCLWLLPYR